MVCVGTSCGSAEDILEIRREVFWLNKSPEMVQIIILDYLIGYTSLTVSIDRQVRGRKHTRASSSRISLVFQ